MRHILPFIVVALYINNYSRLYAVALYIYILLSFLISSELATAISHYMPEQVIHCTFP